MNQPNKSNHISLLLLFKNEEAHLKTNFGWLKDCPVINEIVAIDDNSTDKSAQIVKSWANNNLKISYFMRGLESDFSAQRQFGVRKTKNDWIFWLDCDEIPTPPLISFLNNFKFNEGVYSFHRHDIFLQHQLHHGETANQVFIRLFNRNFGSFVHPVHEIWQSSAPIINTDLAISHYSHQTFHSFIDKINFYSTLRAQELFSQHVSVNLFQIICYPLGKFISDYFFKLGFLDSTPGIILALGMSFHSFLVRAKLWHLSNP